MICLVCKWVFLKSKKPKQNTHFNMDKKTYDATDKQTKPNSGPMITVPIYLSFYHCSSHHLEKDGLHIGTQG